MLEIIGKVLTRDEFNERIGLELDYSLKYEIAKVKTNRYSNEYMECFMLKMWGDKRVVNLEVVTDLNINGKIQDEQHVFHSYFATFAKAKETALKVYEMLAECSKYRNVYMFRENIDIKIVTDIYKNDIYNIVDKEDNYILLNNKAICSTREPIEAYLNANLKGSGWKVANRVGINGTIEDKRVIVVDIDSKDIIYNIVDTNGTIKDFKMPYLYPKTIKDIEDLFLAAEYVISQIWNAKFNKINVRSETYSF